MALRINGMFRRFKSQDIVHRWEGNPLISINELPFQASDIHNANVVEFNRELLLLVTIENLEGQRNIHLARWTQQGNFEVESKPLLKPSTDPKFKQHESGGVLDARATFLDGVYYILYDALGDHGYRLALARTKDFREVERIAMISEPDTKAGALFPKKINNRYARLERPSSGDSIWVTYSDDLQYWGNSQLVITPRGGFWDTSRVGVGPTPIEIDDGWLVLYYGAKDTSSGPIYRIGAAILDKKDPTKIIGRAGIPILAPRERYERLGDVPNLVFTTGAYLDDDGHLHIFYGASDSCICLATATLKDIVCVCEEGKEYC